MSTDGESQFDEFEHAFNHTHNHTHNHTNGTAIDQAVTAIYAVARDDNKTAAIVLFGVFAILAQLLWLKKQCFLDRRRGYVRGQAKGEEGLELVENPQV